MSMLKDLKAKGGSKSELMQKMVKLPEHVTHVGVANVEGYGMTCVVTSELSVPFVYDPGEKKWVALVTKIG